MLSLSEALQEAVLEIKSKNDEITIHEIVDHLGQTDPDLVATYVAAKYKTMLAAEVRHIVNADRRRREKLWVFEPQEEEVPSAWDASHNVVRDGERTYIKLAAMTRTDHLYVANEYQHRAIENGFLAGVHRAFAKRLTGDQRTDEVFTESEAREMFRRKDKS